MKIEVYFSVYHTLHNPPFELSRGKQQEYFENSQRLKNILKILEQDPEVFEIHPNFSTNVPDIKEVHSEKLLKFYAEISKYLSDDDYHIPDTFAVPKISLLPEDITKRSGYFCFDSATPITRRTFSASLNAASTVVKAARKILTDKNKIVYAAVRPPGHHAGKDYFGGYCYLNNSALGAHVLSKKGRVAILDIDYHHGNGTQEIFYDSDRVFFVSLHANPAYAFPYFWGYPEEIGEGPGEGWNLNIVLEDDADNRAYLQKLGYALDAISKKDIDYLIISLGVDTLFSDPVGGMMLTEHIFEEMGREISKLKLPTLIVQEGGYDLTQVGKCVLNFLTGFLG